jgi:hypothetical protein
MGSLLSVIEETKSSVRWAPQPVIHLIIINGPHQSLMNIREMIKKAP